ncbi:MAG TPA: PAS domain S-box protein [Archaeoglobaceae archaeon]|nr:PAS domain S-box protein [Archaeoglobaceae archaeon]
MDGTKVLIVEDENIVAMDIKYTLKNLGYTVSGIASSGEEAIKLVEETSPDIVLMDIMLRGEMDGIQAAEIIRSRHYIPVIYLTAYSDSRTLQRAKVTEPFGYILKPFEEKELKTSIEIALYKHKMERKLKESEKWFSTTLRSIGDAVIATDNDGKVIYMNPMAEELTGWKKDEASGKHISEIYRTKDENSERSVDTLIRVLKEGRIVNPEFDLILVSKNGREIPVNESGAPIIDDSGGKLGAVLVFRNITERKKAEIMIKRRLEFEKTVSRISSRFIGVIDIGMAIKNSLKDLENLSGAERTSLYLWDRDRIKMEAVYESKEFSKPTDLRKISPASFPWLFSKLSKGETILIKNIAEFNEAPQEKIQFKKAGISSLIGLPVYTGEGMEGFLCIYNFKEGEKLLREDLMLLKILSGIFGSGIERQKAEDELRKSLERLQKSMKGTIHAISKIYENNTQKPSRFGRAPGI